MTIKKRSVLLIAMFIKLISNERMKHDYDGEEHGSGGWSKNGEECHRAHPYRNLQG